MAKKYSEFVSALTGAGTLTGTEELAVVRGAGSFKTTLAGWTSALDGDLNIIGAGRKITADMSSNPGRLVMQTSVMNGHATLTLATGHPTSNAISQVNTYARSDVLNSPFARFGISGTEAFFTGSTVGTGDAISRLRFGYSPTINWTIESIGDLRPNADAAYNAGASSLRLKEIFCANATINTSDAREKTTVRPLTTAERAAARDLLAEVGIYQFLSAVAEKGADAARLHEGLTVQRAIEVMKSHGLDPMRYGFICYDEWQESFEEVEDEAGDLVRIVQRQAMRETVAEQQQIEIIDGTPTLVTRPHTERTPITEMRPVVLPDGTPVTEMRPALLPDGSPALDDNGAPILTPEPVMYPVPVMEGVEQRYRRVVTPAGDRYSFRETRLILFILAGLSD